MCTQEENVSQEDLLSHSHILKNNIQNTLNDYRVKFLIGNYGTQISSSLDTFINILEIRNTIEISQDKTQYGSQGKTLGSLLSKEALQKNLGEEFADFEKDKEESFFPALSFDTSDTSLSKVLCQNLFEKQLGKLGISLDSQKKEICDKSL